MSIDAAAADPAVTRMLAGELAKSMWATAKPQGGGDGESAPATSGADTYSSLFSDILADALAGPADTARKAAR